MALTMLILFGSLVGLKLQTKIIKMKKLLVVLLFTPLAVLAQINQQCPQFTANGTPQYQAQPGDQEI